MIIFEIFRHILVILLTLSLAFDYPLALHSLVMDTIRLEDPQGLKSGSP